MFRKIILIILVLFFTHLLIAQEAAGSIIYAEGLEFSVLRGEEYSTYNLYEDDVYGQKFLPGDIIITENSTFLEIQLEPSQNVLKISENTSFQIDNLSPKGAGTFNLTYGRIRAKVKKLLSNEEFEIRGLSIAAGVRGTDYGYDIIARADSSDAPESIVYCFEGEVALNKIVTDKEIKDIKDPKDKFESSEVIIKANEMAIIKEAIDKDEDETISKEVLRSDIQSFWTQNDFKAEPQKIINEANEKLKKEMKLNSQILFSVGTMAEVVGAVIFFGGDNLIEDNEAIGASFMGLGGLLSLASVSNFIKARSLD